MHTTKFSVKNPQGESLAGLVSRPADTNNPRVVLLVHGLGLDMHQIGYDQLVEQLVSKSCVVYRFDFSGAGASQGSDLDVSISKWIEDLETVAKYIAGQHDLYKNKLSVVAHSMGVSVVVESSLNIGKLVVIAPVTDYQQTLKNLFKDNYIPNGISTKSWSPKLSLRVGPKLLEDCRRYNLTKSMSGRAESLLLVQGKLDDKVDPEKSHQLYQQIKIDKHLVEGNFDHMLYPQKDFIVKKLVTFITQTMPETVKMPKV